MGLVCMGLAQSSFLLKNALAANESYNWSPEEFGTVLRNTELLGKVSNQFAANLFLQKLLSPAPCPQALSMHVAVFPYRMTLGSTMFCVILNGVLPTKSDRCHSAI